MFPLRNGPGGIVTAFAVAVEVVPGTTMGCPLAVDQTEKIFMSRGFPYRISCGSALVVVFQSGFTAG